MSTSGHDEKCLHSEYVQRFLNPTICTFCQLIHAVRAEK